MTKMINEIDELKDEIDEIEKWLLNLAKWYENSVIEALKNGHIKQDDFDQMILVAKRHLLDGAPVVHNAQQAFAFAFAYLQVSVNEIRLGVEDRYIAYSIQAVNNAGMASGVIEQSRANARGRSHKAKNAAHARHSKTDVGKQIVWSYYQQELHTFKSYDHAAEKISYKKDVPFAFRTVRKWITEEGVKISV